MVVPSSAPSAGSDDKLNFIPAAYAATKQHYSILLVVYPFIKCIVTNALCAPIVISTLAAYVLVQTVDAYSIYSIS